MIADRHIAEARGMHPGRGITFLLPPLIWAGYFVVIYSFQGAACADDDQASRTVLALLTLGAAGAIAAIGAWGYVGWRRIRSREPTNEVEPPARAKFLAFATITHAMLFFVATIWVGAAIVLLDPCAGRIAGA